MKRSILLSLLFASALLLLWGGGAPDRVVAEDGWMTDYERALARAEKTGRPLLVGFR